MTAAAFPRVDQLAERLRTLTWRDMAKCAWLILVAPLRPGFMGWLKRRPQPALPPGQAFTYLERGACRTGIAIPLVAIADCRRIDVDAHIWRRREGIERHRVLTASALDKPDTALMLTPDSRCA